MEALAIEIGLRKPIFLRKYPNYIKDFENRMQNNVSLRDLPLGYEASGPGTWWDLVYNTPDQIRDPKCHSIYIYPNNVIFVDFNCPIAAINNPAESVCCEYAYKGLITQYCCTPFEHFFQGTKFRTTIAIGFLFSVFLTVFLILKLGDYIAKLKRKKIKIIQSVD